MSDEAIVRQLTRSAISRLVEKVMKEEGLVIKEEPYQMSIPHSQRSGEVIEPMISQQWFVKMESLAKPALEAVRSGEINQIFRDFFLGNGLPRLRMPFQDLQNIQDQHFLWLYTRHV